MKKTNAQLFSLVAINCPVGTSPENIGKAKSPINPSAPDTPPNKKPDGELPDSAPSLPDDGADASLLAYSICMDSWRFALYKKLRNVISGILVCILVVPFLIKYLPLSIAIIWVIVISIVVGLICWFYMHKYVTNYNAMFNELRDINKVPHWEFSNNSKDKMISFINKYAYDKWTKEPPKSQENKS